MFAITDIIEVLDERFATLGIVGADPLGVISSQIGVYVLRHVPPRTVAEHLWDVVQGVRQVVNLVDGDAIVVADAHAEIEDREFEYAIVDGRNVVVFGAHLVPTTVLWTTLCRKVRSPHRETIHLRSSKS